MPRPKSTSGKVRLNLEMPEDMKGRLERLRDETYADSMSEVLRRALAVYEFIWEESQNDSVLIIRNDAGDERQLKIL